MRDPWIFGGILLLIGAPILLYGFLQADQLIRAQYHSHRDDWERDGRPAGFFFWPPGFRRRFPTVWLFRTPAWVCTSPECLARLRRYRLCALVWNIICISIMVMVAKYILAKKTPRLNFVVQHLLGLKEALIGCLVAMSFSWSVVEVFGD